MKLSLDMKDQNTQPLINSSRGIESETVHGSTKPTNFSSYDSSVNRERDDFFMRHNKTTDIDSPIDLTGDASLKKNQVCGMRLKTDAPKHAAVPILGLFATQVMATVFMNAQVIFLLRTNMTFMSEDQIGRMTSLTLTWQLIAQMFASVFAGYGFDRFGRRFMIGLSFVLMVAALVWTPYTSENMTQLCLARMLLGVGAQIQLGNPLINDYIHTSSRGIATVIQNAGWIVGETFAMAVLFNCTKSMKLTTSFHIAAATIGFFGIVLTCLITNHVSKTLLKMRNMEAQNNSSIVGSDSGENGQNPVDESRRIRQRVKQVIKSDPSYIVCFFGSFQIRQIQILAVVCMLLWVTNFVETGYLPDDEAAKTIYTRLLLTSVGGIAIFIPITVKYIDRWNHGVMIAMSFFMRSILLIFGLPFLKTPDGFWTYFVSFWMLLFTGYQSVALESFSMKIMPSDIVGTLRGIFNFFGQIGVLMITILTGVFFDLFGPSVIFIFVGSFDIVLSIITVGLMLCGHMKVPQSSAAANSTFETSAQSQSA